VVIVVLSWPQVPAAGRLARDGGSFVDARVSTPEAVAAAPGKGSYSGGRAPMQPIQNEGSVF